MLALATLCRLPLEKKDDHQGRRNWRNTLSVLPRTIQHRCIERSHHKDRWIRLLTYKKKSEYKKGQAYPGKTTMKRRAKIVSRAYPFVPDRLTGYHEDVT